MSTSYFTSNDATRNNFLYQPTLDTPDLKKDKGDDYVLSWKSKRVYHSKFKPLNTAFLHSRKLSEYRMGMTTDKNT